MLLTKLIRLYLGKSVRRRVTDERKPQHLAAFYEQHAKHRTYFYVIDTRGRLYLEEMVPKNITTSLKDPKFLDFFFKMLQRNRTERFSKIPWVSLCGREENFCTGPDSFSAFVFTDLICASTGKSHDVDMIFLNDTLVYGSTLSFPFDPTKLVYNKGNERLYHRIENTNLRNELGLLHPTIAQKLASFLLIDDEQSTELVWDGVNVKLDTISK